MLRESDYHSLKMGYALIHAYQPQSSTLEVAESIGSVITIPNMDAVQGLRPQPKHKAPANIYSGNYGLGAFPFHTDLAHWYLPPRYLLLRCVIPAAEVVTFLLHFESALADLNAVSIRRALCRPRRRLNGHLALLRLVQPMPTRALFRWDQLFLTVANDPAREIEDHLRTICPENVDTRIVFKSPGDTLIIDNWKIMHGRSAVPEGGLNRLIERVYLSEVKA